ncbi:hypothetical protein M426DRAFT_7128 [Hypoxylon sp. CI-4A]|nr:hypothetical protein M426DRAFT_7128 [Hypoxylon sp. CI-4A]
MAYIVKYLDIDGVFYLSQCSRHFQYLVREERFCKAIIAAKASNTLEAQEAQLSGQFSRAVRRIAKRHQAISQASPYVVGIVGLADSFEYINGMLCYIVESRPQRRLRILDLHGSASYELVVDIPTLIQEAVPRSAKSRKYKFRVLYHAHGITSCLFSFALPNTENWLLILEAGTQQIVTKLRLDSAAKIFVRNNQDYLYFGTHSEEGADGFRTWVLTGFNIKDRSWLSQKMHLASVMGYDIGSTVCFEIIDDHFYGLSNQTDFEMRETDWISYYHCFRFPLGTPDFRMTQTMPNKKSWRRQHAEGPIDDRWGFLKLEKDEATGILYIIESRKEWLTGKSGNRRSYYMTKVDFDDVEVEVVVGRAGGESRNIRETNRAVEQTLRVRSPENVHPGDDSSVMPAFTRSQTYLRSYLRCCSTYFDLVDDAPGDNSGIRRLRLRAGSRRERPPQPLKDPEQIPPREPDFDECIKQAYRPNEFYLFPPEQKPFNQDPVLNKIYGIMNPSDYTGGITATSDERSFIYAIEEEPNGLKFLVYLSFDPAARLAGMSREGHVLGKRHISDLFTEETDRGLHSAGSELGGIVLPAMTEGKGKEKTLDSFPPHSLPSYITAPPPVHTVVPLSSEESTPWAWTERAMHQDLAVVGKTFTFAY